MLTRMTEADWSVVLEDFDAAQSSSLGLRIATTLARQLGGCYRLEPGRGGTIARLEVEALSR